MPNIQINIKNKVARADRAIIVCDNSDYTAVFDFDDEWSAYETKTARFVYGGTYTDVVFSGNECPIPEIHDSRSLSVGVYAGDLHTTTPAYISCVPSILCGNGIPADPTPDVYAQIMELLNNISLGGNPATTETLGLIKVGENLTITEDGVLSADQTTANNALDKASAAQAAADTAKADAATAQSTATDAQAAASAAQTAANTARDNAATAQTAADAAQATADTAKVNAAVAQTAANAAQATADTAQTAAADAQAAANTAQSTADNALLIANTQPDWNQNDPTQQDYVKNRPFYTGDPVETVLVEESTVTFANSGGLYVAQIQPSFEATVGETYKVYWDGTVYECACKDFNGYIAIGNLSIAGYGSDTGEPFIMAVNNGVGIQIVSTDTSASHTFSISGFVPEVVKIDEKYLPEYSVFYDGDPANWSNAKKQQMYDDFIHGKLVLYRYSTDKIGVVLSVFYSKNVGLLFVFFENYRKLRSFYNNAFSNPIELSESGINNLIDDYVNTLMRWKLYQASASEVSVGDLLSMYVAFDSTTNKACILTNTKSDIGSIQLKSPIVTNGDADITLSSSTAGSSKRFKITVDDSGVITATEVS